MSGPFHIEPLGPDHERNSFACGSPPLDQYLKTQVGQDIRRHLANCFVASPAGSSLVAGYYTLSAASVPIADLDDALKKRLPHYATVPAALVGRLAVDGRHQGSGLGAILLADAARRASRSDAAIFALLVDAKDDSAASFYRHHGFVPFASRANSLFLPIATIRKLL